MRQDCLAFFEIKLGMLVSSTGCGVLTICSIDGSVGTLLELHQNC